MVFLRTQSQNMALLDGVTDLPGSAGFGAGPTTATSTAPSLAVAGQALGDQQATSRAPSVLPPGQGLSLDAIGERIGGLRGRAETLGQQFTEQAGPAFQFGAEQQETLRRAVDLPGEGEEAGSDAQLARQAALERSRGILSRQFEGPTELEQGERTRISSDLGALQGVTGTLGRGRGISENIRLSSPGLTPGQARFEAERRGQDIQRGARELGQQSREVQQFLGAEQTRARELAETRKAGATRFREEARGFLGEEETTRRGAVGEEQERIRGEEQAIQTAFEKFQESGDVEDIADFIDPEELKEFRAVGSDRRAAAEAREKIDAQFDDLRDIEPGTPSITRRGREGRTVTLRDGREVNLIELAQAKLSPLGSESQRLGQRLLERQFKLEALFATNSSFFGGRTGKFASVSPISFGLDELSQLRPDARAFAQFGGAVDPSFQQAASEEQIGEINEINRLLGSNKPDLVKEGLERAGIQTQAGELTAQEKRLQTALQKFTTQEAQRFQQTRRRQRKKFKRSDRFAKFRAINPLTKPLEFVADLIGDDRIAPLSIILGNAPLPTELLPLQQGAALSLRGSPIGPPPLTGPRQFAAPGANQ